MAISTGCSGEPETRWGALSIMEIARETDGVSEGFDLDGLDSSEDGADGCGIADYVNESGVEGIDNAMAQLMPILEQTEGAALESLIQQAISRGEVLMLFGLSDLEDPWNDEQITMTFARATGSPILGADGLIVSGQTFDRDPELEPVVVDNGQMQDGLFEASGASVVFPVTIFDATPTLVLEDVKVRFEYDERGDFTGIVGGALNYDILLEGLLNTGIGNEFEAILPMLFESNADLDSVDGPCSRLSITMQVEGVRAHLFD